MGEIDVVSLKTSLVNRFWEDKNESLSLLFNLTEEHEYWTQDDDADFAVSLDRFSKILNQRQYSNKSLMEKEENLFLIMSYIKISKSMRLIQWLDASSKEDLSFKLLKSAIANKDDSPYHMLFVERVLLIKEFNLLNQIYGRKNLSMVRNILKKVKNKNGES